MKFTLLCLTILSAILQVQVFAQDEDGAVRTRRSRSGTVDMTELRAKRMMDNALELLSTGQAERGAAMLEAVNTMFPESSTRFKAALALARYYEEQKQFDKAAVQLKLARESTEAEDQAEAWFRLGTLAFNQANYNEAFANLRRVTNEFPGSPFANHAYDYIGQAHFKEGRWGKAVEAFRMVGTAVPENLVTGDEVLAEAGQRLYVKVKDKDLQILQILGENVSVSFEAESGDKESTGLEKLGRGGEDWLASIRMAPEPGGENDGILTVQGGEWITVTYVDNNTESGEVDVIKTSRVRIVSTGAISITDGAFHRSVKGVFAGQPTYVKLTDLDLDSTAEADEVDIDVAVMYAPVKEEPEEGAIEGLDVTELDQEEVEWLERGRLTLRLTETGPHTGEFRGQFRPVVSGQDTGGEGKSIDVQPGDEVVVSYLDETHLRSKTPETRQAAVKVVVGGSTEPQSIVSVANDADTQGRKLLIEAQLLHRWGSIFKDVGLEDSASLKAEEGLEKVDEIMKLTARQSISRDILEQAFAVKWNLYLVQNELNAAIETCMALVRIFPDTDLVDLAFMNIARARAESDDIDEKREALRVYARVIDLPESDQRAEAQYRMGEVTEEIIKMETKAGTQPNMAPAIAQYQRCADRFPNSPFAGEAFNKILNYHISLRDYTRSVELMDRIVQDYPDAPWLDRVLLQWGVVAHRMGQVGVAKQKFLQVLEEYPNGTAAAKATQFLNQLR
jgi:TolA-binding protein